jgi:hypothetical protein
MEGGLCRAGHLCWFGCSHRFLGSSSIEAEAALIHLVHGQIALDGRQLGVEVGDLVHEFISGFLDVVHQWIGH